MRIERENTFVAMMTSGMADGMNRCGTAGKSKDAKTITAPAFPPMPRLVEMRREDMAVREDDDITNYSIYLQFCRSIYIC